MALFGGHAAPGTVAQASAEHCATEPRTGRALTLDIDGDGRAELVLLERVDDSAWVDVIDASGALRSSTRLGRWDEVPVLEAFDANGDGRTDLIRRWHEGTRAFAEVWLANGKAFDRGARSQVTDVMVAAASFPGPGVPSAGR